MSKMFLSSCVLIGALAFGTQAEADDVCASTENLVQNCGFETGNFLGWSLSGDMFRAGVGTNDAYTGKYGAYFAGFGSFNSGDTTFTEIEQTLHTKPGTSYTLRFHWAHFVNTPVIPDNYFSAYINTQRIPETTQIAVANQPYMNSAPYSFVAKSSVTPLSFLAEDANYYFSLDDVSVTATPEPATSPFVVTALFGLYLFQRRRERQRRAVVTR